MTGGKGPKHSRPAKLPTRDEALGLLREVGCDSEVVKHCEAVSALAVKIARRCDADAELVEIGGLLHDLGRCRTHEIQHAVEGARIAAERGLPEQLVKIIERHVGAGISRAEARKLGLPEKDYSPKTLEEMIVAHADNLISGSRRTSVREAVGSLIRRRLQEPAIKVLRLHQTLSSACGVDVDEII